ncbi:hypothetical protein X801_01069 [Opisthorchis viverrini]|uniref:Uncharacterized protein n=1 Tax=Opisthorchis viverrini TaxID=6198 RepID=A0A1S8X8H6_OPIVI|nr:hypothetical protein X801_01069 [Opisthorchis viverrini]
MLPNRRYWNSVAAASAVICLYRCSRYEGSTNVSEGVFYRHDRFSLRYGKAAYSANKCMVSSCVVFGTCCIHRLG